MAVIPGKKIVKPGITGITQFYWILAFGNYFFNPVICNLEQQVQWCSCSCRRGAEVLQRFCCRGTEFCGSAEVLSKCLLGAKVLQRGLCSWFRGAEVQLQLQRGRGAEVQRYQRCTA